MDWSKGFSAQYYITVVDKPTWRDTVTEDGAPRIDITGGTVKRTMDSLRESADINCINYSTDREQLIRVWLDAKQDGESSHTPLFTGLASSPKRSINGRLETNALQCYSVLKIAQDILLPRGWYAPTGINGGNLIRNLLAPIGAPIHIAENSPALKSAIISESNENNLSMVDKILDAMKTDTMAWRLMLNGKGEIFIEPINKEPVASFSSVDNDILEPTLDITYDWYACPNICRVVSGDTSAIARDDDPNSMVSTINRGREIWIEDTSCYLNENETLADYARRYLKEAQYVATNISYTRRFDPDLRPEKVVRLNYPEQQIFGNFLITSHNIALDHGGRTSEEVVKI